MAGSLYAVVMGPTTLDEPKAEISASTFSIVFFVIGIAVVTAFALTKYSAAKKRS